MTNEFDQQPEANFQPGQQQPNPQQSGPNRFNDFKQSEFMQSTLPNSGREAKAGITALFDLTFRKYVTPSITKFVYIMTLVMAILTWLGGALLMFLIGGIVSSMYMDGSMFTILGVLALIFGWIPGLFQIMLVRVGLELTIANIRTAEDADDIRRHLMG